MANADSIAEVEIWKPIAGFEGLYEVSNFGKIRSVARWVGSRFAPNRGTYSKRFVRERILRPFNTNGYDQCVLCRPGDGPMAYPNHRCVAEAFVVNVDPDIYDTVDHIDANKRNNHWKNLRWVTMPMNRDYAREMGLYTHGEAHHRARLTTEQVLEIKRLYKEGVNLSELSRRLGVTRSSVGHVARGRSWLHLEG